ncbi:hypothetical protein TNCV_1705021 [Trichonephila clavipes]|nr:hypothetical protein TNCV_1705021 [Trichonephila clavipes]
MSSPKIHRFLFVFSFNQNDCPHRWRGNVRVGVILLQGKCNCGVDGQMCSPLGVFAKPKPPPRRRPPIPVNPFDIVE